MNKELTPNALINESSPYLLQHAYNPVNWYPWGEFALNLARTQDKLILVSIGYSACHWCHVMERECFEDEEVAAIMNLHFINIKVDREERPDIDQIYMNAVQLMNNGRGGWPLNCFTLPDGKPIYGGTYFPKSNWIRLLLYLADLWSKNREKAQQFGTQVSEAVQLFEFIDLPPAVGHSITREDIERIYTSCSQTFDLSHGGSGGAPKFPLPVNWKFFLHYASCSDNESARQAVKLALDKMVFGGIYDQIGGGFARYSTDARWFLPHFEKMLYDNAQLIELYTEAWQYFRDPLYREVVEETIECILRDFRNPNNGSFYSAYDADSEGEEGKYYVWTLQEVQNVLGDEARWLIEYYHISDEGNWEHGKNILYRQLPDLAFAETHGLTLDEWTLLRDKLRKQLLQARSERVPPGLDDKVLTSWNALTIKALLRASRVFKQPIWQAAALDALRFILQSLTDGNRLWHSWKKDRASINGFADDYAFIIEALLEAHRSTFDPTWAKQAQVFMDYVIEHFSHEATGLFFYTSDLDPALIARKQELYDNVIPSSNASLAHSLKTLGWLFESEDYIKRSRAMLDCVWSEVTKHGMSFSYWADLGLRMAVPEPELVFTGTNSIQMRDQVLDGCLGLFELAGTLSEGDTLPVFLNRWRQSGNWLYICRNSTCEAPTNDPESAIETINKLTKFV